MASFPTVAVAMALTLAVASAPADAALGDQTATSWKLYESAEGCALAGQSRGDFVFLAINPEGEAMLRIHHPDIDIAARETRSAAVMVGLASLSLSVTGGNSSDGTPGFTSRLAGDWRSVLAADGDATVTVSPGKPIPLNLAGLAEALPELDGCSARLKPREPETIAVVKPRLRRMPNIDASQLPLADATRREVGFRLTVSPEGKANNCEITKSSGAASLDGKVCRLLIAGTRFAPARNGADMPVTGTFQSRVVF